MRAQQGALNILGVWPGDTNRDCLVDVFDVLPLGTSFGNEGPPRSDQGLDISWTPKAFRPWGGSSSSPNFGDSFVDGTGDGQINQNDLLPIGVNFGNNRYDLPGSECQAASKQAPKGNTLFAQVDVPPTTVGETFVVELATPIVQQGLLGVAFELHVPLELFRVTSATPGLLLDDGDLLAFDRTDPNSGVFSAAFSRKGTANMAIGNGPLVYVTIEVIGEMHTAAPLTLTRAAFSHVNGQTNTTPPVTLQLLTATATSNDGAKEVPNRFRLHGAYPNPFNPTTTLSFDLPEPAELRLVVYDLLGRIKVQRALGRHRAGRNQLVRFDASQLTSGMYVYRLEAQTAKKTQFMTGRFVLLK